MDEVLSRRLPRTWLWGSVWICIVAAGLVLRWLESPFYIFGSGYDDELMVRMASGLLHGHWSTSWQMTGQATLAKSVGFPLFLSGAHFFPWSPLVSGYLLYLVGAILIAWSWWRISSSKPQTTVLLAALVFNPIFFTYDSQRVYRDIFINDAGTMAIGMAFVAAAVLTTRATRSHPMHPESSDGQSHSRTSNGLGRLRRYGTYVFILAISALMGVVVGGVVITKATWPWLIVAVAAPLVYPVARLLRRSARRMLTALRVVLAVAVAALGSFAVVETTKLMNERTYHVALVEDFSTGAYARAWKLWASVEAGPPRKYVPIARAMRMAVYRVSPAAAEMEPFLESPRDYWRMSECQSMRICDESGTLFEWDLRDAAVATGRIHSARDIQRFFTSVADDIARTCASGRLRCSSSPVLATGLPTLNQIPPATVARFTVRGISQMIWDQLPIRPPSGLNDRPPTQQQYRLWTSVVPGMSSIDTVARGTSPPQLYPLLRFIDSVYGVANVLLLLIVAFGCLSWVVDRRSRRRAPHNRLNVDAASASALFLLSALVGVGTLAIFQTADPGWILPLYWADFATPAELFVVFAAFASWPLLEGRIAASPLRRMSEIRRFRSRSTTSRP